VSTPASAGLKWFELHEAIATVFNTVEVVGCDVTEYAPKGNSPSTTHE